MTTVTKYEWLDQLWEDEACLGDSGFKGFENSNLFTPPKDKVQKNIFNSIRVIIENVFVEIKNWRICSDRSRCNVSDKEHLETSRNYHNNNWIIICSLQNLQLNYE